MLAKDQARNAECQKPVQPVSLERPCLVAVVRCLPPSLRKRSKKAHKHAKKTLARIERLVAEGRTRDAAQLSRMYGHSHDAKFGALFDANKKLPRGLRTKGSELHKIADEMDLRQPQGSATYRAERKPKGGYRPVMNFTLPARAAQLVLKRAARPFLKIRKDQFAVENGGAPAEGRRIVELAAKGYGWFIEGDIANCYATINPDGVKELPGGSLGRMMEANATSRSVRASIRKTMRKLSSIDISNLQQQVRSGIPQGSLFSPLAAEAAIATVLDDAEQRPNWPNAVRLVCHADNIAIFGRTQADAEQAADILREAFKRSRVGPLKLLCKDARSIRQGFDFLGIRYTYARRPEVSPANRSKCVTWISNMVRDHSIPTREIKRRVRSWGAAMGLRKNDRYLTLAAQWANSVLRHALYHQLRGHALRRQSTYEHRALHEPGFMHEHG